MNRLLHSVKASPAPYAWVGWRLAFVSRLVGWVVRIDQRLLFEIKLPRLTRARRMQAASPPKRRALEMLSPNVGAYSFVLTKEEPAAVTPQAWESEGEYNSLEAADSTSGECAQCYTWARGKGMGSNSVRAGGIKVATKGCTSCQACPALVCPGTFGLVVFGTHPPSFLSVFWPSASTLSTPMGR